MAKLERSELPTLTPELQASALIAPAPRQPRLGEPVFVYLEGNEFPRIARAGWINEVRSGGVGVSFLSMAEKDIRMGAKFPMQTLKKCKWLARVPATMADMVSGTFVVPQAGNDPVEAPIDRTPIVATKKAELVGV